MFEGNTNKNVGAGAQFRDWGQPIDRINMVLENRSLEPLELFSGTKGILDTKPILPKNKKMII